MTSSTSHIRKRPVVTYSKKSRTYLSASSSTDDSNDQEHVSKRVRITIPHDENDDTISIEISKGGPVEPMEPASSTTAEMAADESEDGTDTEKEPTTSVASSQMRSEAQAAKGDTISSTCTKITGFTISTRRKPLFKRHTAKKLSDTHSSSPSLSSTPLSTQSSTSTVSSSSTARSQKQKLVQMQIDLDGIGAPKVSCKECGMQYVPSADEDAKLHKRYHAQVVEGLEFGNTRAKVVWEGKLQGGETRKRQNPMGGKKDGKVGTITGTTTGEKENLTPVPITRFFASGRGEKTANGKKLPPPVQVSTSTSTTCYIVEITRRSTPTEKKKATEFLRFANRELSAQEVDESVLWGSSPSGPGDGETDKGEQFKIYLYLEGTKCVGLCLVEKIKEAQWATTREGDASISCSLDISDTKQSALLGISRIWTCPKRRRHGVASRLVDSAVDSFVYGMKVAAGMVAFSQPTDSGAWFALGWVDGQMVGDDTSERDVKKERGFLVYLDGV
ncbi:hypothetical protein TWF281_003641 [Arthrobotrys megalospora]